MITTIKKILHGKTTTKTIYLLVSSLNMLIVSRQPVTMSTITVSEISKAIGINFKILTKLKEWHREV